MITAQDNTTIVRTVLDLFNQRKLDEATKHVAPQYSEIDAATGETKKGPQGWKTSSQAWIDAFPDAKVEILNVFANEQYVATEFVGRGTHNGTLNTPQGPIPATGKKVELHFCQIARLENGKLIEGRQYYDVGTMLKQIGALK